MNYAANEQNYTLRLDRGELVVENLLGFVKDQNIKGGWVTGLGGLAWAELGFYDLNTEEYSWTKLEEPLELTNLTGNVAWKDGEPALHLHATVSDFSLHARGGHLKEAETAGTVEIFITRNETGFERSHDDNTGLNLLNL